MKVLFTSFFVVPLFLVGCTAEGMLGGDLIPSPITDSVPLNIESVTINAETRAALMGSIGIFLSGADYITKTNFQYNSYVPSWVPNNSVPIYLTGSTASICAYYPYQSTFNSLDIPIASEVYTYPGNDPSFATNRNINNVSRSFSFAMKRACAKVTFTFQRDGYTNSCVVSKIELKNGLPSTTLNIGTGEYSSTMGVEGTTVSQSKSITVPTSGTIAWGNDIMLVPCTPASSGMQIVITVDGQTMATTIPTASYKPVAGEYKNILLTIKKPISVSITKVSVSIVDNRDYEYGSYASPFNTIEPL